MKTTRRRNLIAVLRRFRCLSSTKFSLCVAAAALLTGCAHLGPKTIAVDRFDYSTAKIRTLNEVMKLTAEEADKFWPIYRNYEKELAAVGDRKLALIREFIIHHKAGSLTDPNSKAMAAQWLQNVQDRLDLWKKYHQQFSVAVSPVRAAQFLQVEHQIALFVDIEIASEMPMVGEKPQGK